jgi:hypothetical protein
LALESKKCVQLFVFVACYVQLSLLMQSSLLFGRQLRLDHRTFTTPSQRKVELTTIASNYHIECNPADVGNNDRLVVQEVIKEIASSHPVVATGAAASFKGCLAGVSGKPCRNGIADLCSIAVRNQWSS